MERGGGGGRKKGVRESEGGGETEKGWRQKRGQTASLIASQAYLAVARQVTVGVA